MEDLSQRRSGWLGALLLGLLTLGGSAISQGNTSGAVPTTEVDVIISDPVGALISHAEVTFHSEETVRTQASDCGAVRLTLPYGRYVVTITSPGFKTKEITGFLIGPHTSPVLNASLEVASYGDFPGVEVPTVAFDLPSVISERDQGSRRVPAVDVSTPNRALKIKAHDACSVDFRNIRMFGENADWTAKMKNGKYERKSSSGYQSASLDQVFCFDHEERSEQFALVMTNWLDCGGSCTSIGVVQLFSVRAAHPVIAQQFVFDAHAAGTGATFDKTALTLTIVGRSDDGSPNCCAKNFDVATYRWQGTKFVQQEYKRVSAPLPQRLGDGEPPALR